MTTLLTIGETMGVAASAPGAPLRTAGQLRLSTAGAESTVAIGMRRLGHTATWVGTVGTDEIGQRVIRELAAEGVDTRFIRQIDGMRTGFMLRDHRTPDHVCVDYYRAGLAGAQLSPQDVDSALALLDDVSILHLTGITPALSPSCHAATWRAIEVAKKRGITVSFDVNHRTALATTEQARQEARSLVPHVDVLFVGDDELHLLTEEADPIAAAVDLCALGPAEVVVKRGGQGAVTATGDGVISTADALKVNVIDVIGAGDSFVAGYLAARASGLGAATRLSWGTICAACTVGTHGDWEGLPTRKEMDQRGLIGKTIR